MGGNPAAYGPTTATRRLLENSMHQRILRDGDLIATPYGSAKYPELERFYTIGTTRHFYSTGGYASRGVDPDPLIAESIAKGHPAVWANQNGACISDSAAFRARDAAERASAMRVKVGDIIAVHDGRDLHVVRIHRAPNGNIDLRRDVPGVSYAAG